MNNGRRPLTFILVAAFAGFLVYAASHSKGIRQNVARRDSIQYWAGANLLINHHNPYDIDKVFELLPIFKDADKRRAFLEELFRFCLREQFA